MPPTLSLCPFRNLVVLCVTMSPPSSSGRWMYGLANVLSTMTRTPWRCAISLAAARSVIRSIGLVGVSMNRYLVFWRDGRLDQVEARGIHVGEVEAELAAHALEETERAAVGVVADDEMVAGFEPRQDGVDGGHARGEGKRGRAALDRCEVGFERHAGGVLGAAVFESLVLAESLLHVGGGLIDRRDDGAGRWDRVPDRRECRQC